MEWKLRLGHILTCHLTNIFFLKSFQEKTNMTVLAFQILSVLVFLSIETYLLKVSENGLKALL